MTTLVLRDFDNHLVALLELRAKANGRSAEAEHRAILEVALCPADSPPSMSREEFILMAKRLQDRTRGNRQIDSAEIIRGFRDRDGAI
jgi:plasmid stability protein